VSAVIIFQGIAGSPIGRSTPVPIGAYLRSYDPEAFDGRGDAGWTTNLDAAMVFPDSAAAFACWRQQPRCRPLREDGQPNRPLTAFTVEVRTLREDTNA
jgi:hypothetical protein